MEDKGEEVGESSSISILESPGLVNRVLNIKHRVLHCGASQKLNH